MKLKVEVELNVTKEDIEDIIDMAGYGIYGWCSAVRVGDDYYKVYEDEENKWHKLSHEDILKGIKMYIENGNHPYNILDGDGGIDTGNVDAEVADTIIQYCCFGEIVYC